MSGKYRKLLGRLKDRRDSKVRRSDPARKAEQQKREAEYSANQDRYRGDFEIEGDPFAMRQQVVVGWHNPETGASWSAPNPGYKPKEGTGWVKGYRPSVSNEKPPMQQLGGGLDFSGLDRPISSIKEKPPAASTSDKGKDFEAMLRSRMSKF
jgi:hypothetical protein